MGGSGPAFPEPPFPPSPFWDFSLEVYGRPGAAAACLALQERHGLDVNLLLFCCWAGSRGRRLSAAELARLTATVEAWQAEVVRPLRGIRRWLKGRGGELGGASETLRAEIKARELDAEHLEQLILERALPLAAGAPCPSAAAASLRGLLEAQGIIAEAADRDDLTALLAAAFPAVGRSQLVQLLA